jgi:hypothetical protein
MASKFVLLCGDLDKATADRITVLMKADPAVAWWHYFAHSWLFIDVDDRSLEFWRDQIRNMDSTLRFALVRASDLPAQWTGAGNPTEFKWLRDVWDRSWDPPIMRG